ncbi:MAG TPA: hypothetical protein VLC08_04310, partial [Chitinolyticbacter sp.]|nr:hypothetical protein [Chitinolyticbacter sp.]
MHDFLNAIIASLHGGNRQRAEALVVQALLDEADPVAAACEWAARAGEPALQTLLCRFVDEQPAGIAAKRELARHLMTTEPLPWAALRELAPWLADTDVATLAERAGGVADPHAAALVARLALFHPQVMRPWLDRYPQIVVNVLPGAPDAWVAERLQRYRQRHDVGALFQLAQIRSNAAIEALLG